MDVAQPGGFASDHRPVDLTHPRSNLTHPRMTMSTFSSTRARFATIVLFSLLASVPIRNAFGDASCDTLAGPTSCGTHSNCTYKVSVVCGTLSCIVDYKVVCNGGRYTCGKTQSVLTTDTDPVCLTSCPCSCCVSPGAGASWGSVSGCNFDHSCS